ncbi:hypothetical protein ACFYPC_29785 [Streptomyces sp. NPDC005808]|uniref:hypothetical protein n=1 Tax=Streptomyces sp. NPDC005808 TaxID=3364734 RepID=UPI003673B3D2
MQGDQQLPDGVSHFPGMASARSSLPRPYDAASVALPRAAPARRRPASGGRRTRLPPTYTRTSPPPHLVADMRHSVYPAALDMLLTAAAARPAEITARGKGGPPQ